MSKTPLVPTPKPPRSEVIRMLHRQLDAYETNIITSKEYLMSVVRYLPMGDGEDDKLVAEMAAERERERISALAAA